MKQLVYRRNRLGVGVDVGWRVTDRDGVVVTIKWGNVKDTALLLALLADCRLHGHECELGGELTEPWDMGDRRR